MRLFKLLTSSILALGMIFSLSSHGKPISGKEHQAVVDTAYRYFNGMAMGDQALLGKAFDLEFGHVKMIQVDKDTNKETIRSLPLREFASFFKKATEDQWEANILSVDIVDSKMAMVKLDFDTPKNHYVDYLVMYKREGQWRIINKTFVARKKSS